MEGGKCGKWGGKMAVGKGENGSEIMVVGKCKNGGGKMVTFSVKSNDSH